MENLVQFPAIGLEMTINRVAISIGGFDIYWYGILLGAGLVGGLCFAFRYAVDFGVDGDRLVDVVVIGTIMAIVCARAYYVAMAPFEYQSLWEMIDLRNGGIAVYGSLIGAFVFGGLACKWRKIPLLATYDMVAMGFLIGQAIGRWGNFVNQEAFGTNTTLPWGMYSQATNAYLASAQAMLAAEGVAVDPTMPVHPTFLYESLWCALGFVLLFLFMKKRKFNGEIFLLYAIWYGTGRFWIEGLRTDALMISVEMNLRASQLVAVVTVVVAAVLELFFRKKFAENTLMVPLAVADLKAYAAAYPDGPCVRALSAGSPHSEFEKATDEWNKSIKELAAANKEKPAESTPAEE